MSLKPPANALCCQQTVWSILIRSQRGVFVLFCFFFIYLFVFLFCFQFLLPVITFHPRLCALCVFISKAHPYALQGRNDSYLTHNHSSKAATFSSFPGRSSCQIHRGGLSISPCHCIDGGVCNWMRKGQQIPCDGWQRSFLGQLKLRSGDWEDAVQQLLSPPSL